MHIFWQDSGDAGTSLFCNGTASKDIGAFEYVNVKEELTNTADVQLEEIANAERTVDAGEVSEFYSKVQGIWNEHIQNWRKLKTFKAGSVIISFYGSNKQINGVNWLA